MDYISSHSLSSFLLSSSTVSTAAGNSSLVTSHSSPLFPGEELPKAKFEIGPSGSIHRPNSLGHQSRNSPNDQSSEPPSLNNSFNNGEQSYLASDVSEYFLYVDCTLSYPRRKKSEIGIIIFFFRGINAIMMPLISSFFLSRSIVRTILSPCRRHHFPGTQIWTGLRRLRTLWPILRFPRVRASAAAAETRSGREATRPRLLPESQHVRRKDLGTAHSILLTNRGRRTSRKFSRQCHRMRD